MSVFFIYVQVIQLQGDQRKNVSTFLFQVMLYMFTLTSYLCRTTLFVLCVILLLSCGQTGWLCEEGFHQDPWFLSWKLLYVGGTAYA